MYALELSRVGLWPVRQEQWLGGAVVAIQKCCQVDLTVDEQKRMSEIDSKAEFFLSSLVRALSDESFFFGSWLALLEVEFAGPGA